MPSLRAVWCCRTCLMHAADVGRIDVARVLLDELGADIECKDKDNDTALCYAVRSGRLTMVKLLLRAGAAVEPCLPEGSPEIEGLLEVSHQQQLNPSSFVKPLIPSLILVSWVLCPVCFSLRGAEAPCPCSRREDPRRGDGLRPQTWSTGCAGLPEASLCMKIDVKLRLSNPAPTGMGPVAACLAFPTCREESGCII